MHDESSRGRARLRPDGGRWTTPRSLFPAVCLLLLAALPAGAQEAAAPTPPPEPPKIDVTGFVDVYYLYDFNKVDPALRTFDVQHNAFSLSLAEIAFAKGVTTDSRVGFRIDLDFGKTADLVAAYEPEADGKEIYKHVQQAYLSVLAGSKLQLDAGKFVTPLGAEVIESQDNWNYSRSVLFGYAIPFYHTGLRATAPGERQAHLRRLPRQRLEQQQRDPRRLPVRRRHRHREAERQADLDRQLHGRNGDRGRGHAPHLRHDAHREPDVEAQPPGQLRLRQGRLDELVGRRGLREGARSSRAGRSSAATSTSTTRTAAS